MSDPSKLSAASRWRRYLPHHSGRRTRQFEGTVWQLAGGRTWSLCLITRIRDEAPKP